jgi:hypothetical protein
MAPVPTGLLDPKTPRREIKIVMNENQVVDGQRQLSQKPF